MIFSIAKDADNSVYVKFIATYAPTFFVYIILVLAKVICLKYTFVNIFSICKKLLIVNIDWKTSS